MLSSYHTVPSDKLLKRFQFTSSSAALLSALLSTLLRIVFAVLLSVDFDISSALLQVLLLRSFSVSIPVLALSFLDAIPSSQKVSRGCIAKEVHS